jgi:hypothetical protein
VGNEVRTWISSRNLTVDQGVIANVGVHGLVDSLWKSHSIELQLTKPPPVEERRSTSTSSRSGLTTSVRVLPCRSSSVYANLRYALCKPSRPRSSIMSRRRCSSS